MIFFVNFNLLKNNAIKVDTDVDSILIACKKLAKIKHGAIIVLQRKIL